MGWLFYYHLETETWMSLDLLDLQPYDEHAKSIIVQVKGYRIIIYVLQYFSINPLIC